MVLGHALIRPDAPSRRRREVVLRPHPEGRPKGRRRRRAARRRADRPDRRRSHRRELTASTGSRPARFVTHVAKAGANTRYWLEIRGTKGVIHVGFGILPVALLCEDPAGMFGKSKAPWQEITSAGLGKPETARRQDDRQWKHPDRQRPDRSNRKGPRAARQHSRRPRGAGDDPRRLRVASPRKARRLAAQEPQAPARGDVNCSR